MRREDFDYCVFLEQRAKNLDLSYMFTSLLADYPQFKEWSGSHNKMLHHYEQNGLARHTAEVVELGYSTIQALHLESEVNLHEFYLAALFHDTGKMFDYKRVTNRSVHGDPRPDTWEPTEHRRLIHHLPRSVLIFHDIAKEHNIPEGMHDAVVHAILAHHGAREFGSPVAPKTRVAWLLHLCDGLSARMDDCDRLDVVKKP